MSLPRAYRNYTNGVPQWSIRVTGGTIDHPLQGQSLTIPPVRDSISVLKTNIVEYLYIRILNSCPGFCYVLTETWESEGTLICTIRNKTADGFEIINTNPIPI